MTNSIDDIAEHAAAFFVIGSNTTEQHPVIGMRIRQAVRQRDAVLIVADPRRIDLTDYATIHLRHKPGTDIALVNGLMNIILANGWEDESFIAARTEGFDDFKSVVEEYSPDRASKITGVPVEQLQQAAKLLAEHKPTAVLWAMGITQHITGTHNVISLANLQMLLGNMGVPGGGTNPLRGQNNVQGACDLGGLPNFYPGYQKVTNADARHKFEKAWGLATGALSDEIGLTATEMMPAAAAGKLKALYILGEDPMMSEPDTSHIRHCLETCDFVLLQEIFPSETAPYADVMFPGASFAEKDGTFTNTER
jgi:formate dehydrogenase major subunit/formate dehydrogenase alpha subunit